MGRKRFKLSSTHVEYRKAQGHRLREMRHDSGYSLAKVEQLTGVSKATLGYVERGQNFARIPEILTLAAFYNVTSQYIVEGGTLRRELKSPLQTVAAQVAEQH